VALLGTPTPALATDGPGGTSWTFKFSSQRTKTPVSTHSLLEPAIRNDKGTPDESDDTFAAAKKSVIQFPRGSRVATDIPKLCKATPSEIGSGRAHCAGKTKVGSGAAVSLVGATALGGGTRLNATIDAYNQKTRIVFVVQPCGLGTGPTTGRSCAPAGSVIVLVGKWRGVNRSPRLIVPTPPALLSAGITIVRFELKTRKIVKRMRNGKRSFVTTPGRCNGGWTSSATESYLSESKLTIKHHQPCR
jgi:hypothetical protein